MFPGLQQTFVGGGRLGDEPKERLRRRLHVIGFVADLLFFTLESGLNNIRICRIRVDGSRIREEKVADSKISGYVWTGPKFLALSRV